MEIFIISTIVLGILILLMSVGTLVSNIQLKGSCGGNEDACLCSPEDRKKCIKESLIN